jgi:uncharacterized Ntn-hydrolase superfamily protein
VTYSIVARDEDTGTLGVAALSHWLAVGTSVTWAEPGVGVVATQSLTEPSFGPRGLALLRDGTSPSVALRTLLADDNREDRRQVAVLGRSGEAAVHTGEHCVPDAGHRTGSSASAQGNMLAGPGVLDAMLASYEQTSGDLAERLLAALQAGVGAGGDLRGAQSAALLVVTLHPREDWRREVDLRVDDHPAPADELARLVRLQRAYALMRQGRLGLEKGDPATVEPYRRAHELTPDQLEVTFWYGVALAVSGDTAAARDVLAPCLETGRGWSELLRRLPAAGLLDRDIVDRLQNDEVPGRS